MPKRTMKVMRIHIGILNLIVEKTKKAMELLQEGESVRYGDTQVLPYLDELCEVMTDPDSFSIKVSESFCMPFEEAKSNGDEIVLDKDIFFDLR